MRKGLILIGLLASCGISNGQTIHINDFDYFVGCFARTDTLNRESIDCSEFVEWQLVKPDSDGYRRDINKFESTRNKHWVWDWDPLSNQSKNPCGPRYRQSSNGYEFYILMDLFGHERQINVLTAWQRVGRDSLRYFCGQVGYFDSFIGASRIERVQTFPDSSIILVVKKGGEGFEEYGFYHGSINCDFRKIYSKSWSIPYSEDSASYVSYHYNFEHLRRLSYKVTEVTEFITLKLEDPKYELYSSVIDSAEVRVIDLWEMAKK